MKFTTLFFLCFFAFAFASCGDDDDDMAVDPAIVGTWKLEEQNTKSTSQINGSTTVSNNTYESGNVTITFNADGTFTQMGTSNVRVESTTNGNTTTINSTLDNTTSGEFTARNGVFVGLAVQSSTTQASTANNPEIKYEISGDELKLTLEPTVATVPDGQGGTFTTTQESTSTYKRQ